jgi:S1-C subfamily serine protease
MDGSQEIEEYPSDRGQVVPRPRGIRSRITNGSKMLPDVDERAGLKPGDLVTELDGAPVRDAADL